MVKFKIKWSIEARLDLIQILDFYLQRNGTSAYSIKINAHINKGIKLIAKNPFIGIKTDHHDVRTLIIGDYQLLYELANETILIVMVWDCRRNPEDKIIPLSSH